MGEIYKDEVASIRKNTLQKNCTWKTISLAELKSYMMYMKKYLKVKINLTHLTK